MTAAERYNAIGSFLDDLDNQQEQKTADIFGPYRRTPAEVDLGVGLPTERAPVEQLFVQSVPFYEMEDLGAPYFNRPRFSSDSGRPARRVYDPNALRAVGDSEFSAAEEASQAQNLNYITPVQIAGRALNEMGRFSKAVVADVANLPAAASRYNRYGENLSAPRGEKLPTEKRLQDSGWAGVPGEIGLGLAETIPKIAVLPLAGPSLVAQSAAAGALFGIDENGTWKAKDAAFAALLPAVGAAGKKAAAKAIAKAMQAGVTALDNATAQKVIEIAGEQAFQNAYSIAHQTPTLLAQAEADPDAFKKSLANIVGSNLAFALLGVKNLADDSIPSETQAWFQENGKKLTDTFITNPKFMQMADRVARQRLSSTRTQRFARREPVLAASPLRPNSPTISGSSAENQGAGATVGIVKAQPSPAPVKLAENDIIKGEREAKFSGKYKPAAIASSGEIFTASDHEMAVDKLRKGGKTLARGGRGFIDSDGEFLTLLEVIRRKMEDDKNASNPNSNTNQKQLPPAGQVVPTVETGSTVVETRAEVPAETPGAKAVTDDELLKLLEVKPAAVAAKPTRKTKAKEPAAVVPESKTFLSDERAARVASNKVKLEALKASKGLSKNINLPLLGVSPETIEIYQDTAQAYLEELVERGKGAAVRFADFSKKAIDEIGDEVRPYLRKVFADHVGGKLSDQDAKQVASLEKEHFITSELPALSAIPKDELFAELSKLPGPDLTALLKKVPGKSELDRIQTVADMPDVSTLSAAEQEAAINQFHSTPAGSKRNSVIAAIVEKVESAGKDRPTSSKLESLDGKELTHEDVDFENTTVGSSGEKKNQATEPAFIQVSDRELRRSPDAIVKKILSGASGKQSDSSQTTRRVIGLQDNETGQVHLVSVFDNPNAAIRGASKARKSTSLERAFLTDPEKVSAGKTNRNSSLAEILGRKSGDGTPRYTVLDSARLRGTVESHLQTFDNRAHYESRFANPAARSSESAKTGAEAMESVISAAGAKEGVKVALEDEAAVHAQNIEDATAQTSGDAADRMMGRAGDREETDLTEPPTEQEEGEVTEADLEALAQIPMVEAPVSDKNRLSRANAISLVETLENAARDNYDSTLADSLESFETFNDLMNDAWDSSRTAVDSMFRIAKALLESKSAKTPTEAAKSAVEHVYEILTSTYGKGKGASIEGILRSFGDEDSVQASAQKTTPSSTADRLISKIDSVKKSLNSRANVRINFFGGLDVATANLVLDVAKASIKAGKAIADAVNDGIDWLQTQNAKFDEDEVRQAFDELFTREKVSQAGETSVAQLAKTMVTDLQKKAEPIVGKTTNAARLQRRVAKKVLSRADVKRNFVRPLGILQESVKRIGAALTDWKTSQTDTELSTEAKSAATGKALSSIDTFENDNRSFQSTYDTDRAKLKEDLDKVIEAKGETKGEVAALDALMEDITEMLNQSISANSATQNMDNLRALVSRLGGVRNIMSFLLSKGVPLADMVSMSKMDASGIIAELEKATGEKFGSPEFRQAVGAADDTTQLFVDYLLQNRELQQELTDAKQVVNDSASVGMASAVKTEIAAAVKAGNYEKALEIFSDGFGKTAAIRAATAKVANFFAAQQRKLISEIVALDETKKLYIGVASDSSYKSMRAQVLDALHVADITKSATGHDIRLKAIPSSDTADETVIRLDTAGSILSQDNTKAAKWLADAMDYISHPDAADYDPSIANGLKEAIPAVRIMMQDTDVASGRDLPSIVSSPLRFFGNFFGGLTQTLADLERYVAGPAGNEIRSSGNAVVAAEEGVRRIVFNKYHSKMRIALDKALKSHEGMGMADYKRRVFNPYVGSLQYFENVRQHKTGSRLATGEIVTKEDAALLALSRDIDREVGDMVHGKGNVAKALKLRRAGVIEKGPTGSRIRDWFETGPATASRRLGEVKNLVLQWAGEADKAAWWDRQPVLLQTFVEGSAEPEVAKNYQYGSEFKKILSENDVPSNLGDLSQRVLELYNDENPADPTTLADVQSRIVSELNHFMSSVESMAADDTAKSKKSVGFYYGGETPINTARTRQVMPSGWYDYGHVNDGEMARFAAAAIAPFMVDHIHATDAAKRAVSAKAQELNENQSGGSDFYTASQARRADEELGQYLGNLNRIAKHDDAGGNQNLGILAQYLTGSALTGPTPLVGNLFGGAFMQAHEAASAQGRNPLSGIGLTIKNNSKAVYDSFLRTVGSDQSPAGRKMQKILRNSSVRNFTNDVSNKLADYLNQVASDYDELRAAGVAGSMPENLTEDLDATRRFWKSGGTTQEQYKGVAGKAGGLLQTGARTVARVAGLPVLKADAIINEAVAPLATHMESVLRARVINAFKARESAGVSSPITERELVGSWSRTPEAIVSRKAGRVKERLKRADIEIQTATSDFWTKYKEADAQEKAQNLKPGTLTNKLRMFDPSEMNSLRLAIAEATNLATFRSRPLAFRMKPVGKLLQFLSYSFGTANELFGTMARNSRVGKASGTAASLPTALAIALAAGVFGTAGKAAAEWLNRHILKRRSAAPTPLDFDNTTSEQKAKILMYSASMLIPFYGAGINLLGDSPYRRGYDLNAISYYLNLGSNFLGAVKEAWQTKSPVRPAMKFAASTLFPLNYILPQTSEFEGINEGRFVANELRSSATGLNLETLLKQPTGAKIRYTPASPILDDFLNSVGKGDQTGAREAFDRLVELNKESGMTDKKAVQSATRAIKSRSPVSQAFGRELDPAEMEQVQKNMTGEGRSRLDKFMATFNAVTGGKETASSGSTTSRPAAVQPRASSGSSYSSRLPRLSASASIGYAPRARLSTPTKGRSRRVPRLSSFSSKRTRGRSARTTKIRRPRATKRMKRRFTIA